MNGRVRPSLRVSQTPQGSRNDSWILCSRQERNEEVEVLFIPAAEADGVDY